MITDLAKELRTAADRLEQQAKNLTMPSASPLGMADAFTKLRLVIGPTPLLSIELRLRQYSADDKIEAEWTVYDGEKHHKAATLQAVVDAILAARRPAPADPVTDAEQSLGIVPTPLIQA